MIAQFVYGNPVETFAVVKEVPLGDRLPFFTPTDKPLTFSCSLDEDAAVYGLGQTMRGINKRGHRYISFNYDDPHHKPDMPSMYGSHNFIVVDGEPSFGVFFDTPAKVVFDVDSRGDGLLSVSCASPDLRLYVITGEDAQDVVRQFLGIIGPSFLPPLWAFGYGQSRWGYRSEKDVARVAAKHREAGIPLDYICMDIDYMDRYRDFTVSKRRFPDLAGFAARQKAQGIHLVPIVDAGIKIEPGDPVYEEGVKRGLFCKNREGGDFQAEVWPGMTHFPDFLQERTREWFGGLYKFYTDQGLEGFWNDMNEPAIFYTPEGVREAAALLREYARDEAGEVSMFQVREALTGLQNNQKYYESFYHRVDGQMVRHDKVHNLFGYNMTRAAAEGFEQIDPDRRFLLFSRSSYIGMHRYGGIWTGDNKSWWNHILLNLQMMPSLNMCGFLYIGADLGGFGDNATRDLLLRWLALGVFTPLMRNHSAIDTREQECYRFEHVEDFRHVIGVRYRLLPYLYSEYMKAALSGDLYFKPLSFEYPGDSFAPRVEDQLMLGGEVMIAPVYTQNAKGRYVYLPEKMMFVKFMPDGVIRQEELAPGHHYVEIDLNEVPLFIRAGKCIPLADVAESVAELRADALELLGYPGAEYLLYDDDGIHKDYGDPANKKLLRKTS